MSESLALRHVILGLLEEPASGYDIKQQLDSLSHLWAAESSQIYGTLRGMEDEGLLTSKMQKSDKGPDRRVYRRTTAGRKQLETWLDGDPELGQERLSVLAQIHFLGRARDPAQASEFLIRVRERFVERLKQYEALRARAGKQLAQDKSPKKDLLDNLALDLGLETLRARVKWCDNAIAKLTKGVRRGSAHA